MTYLSTPGRPALLGGLVLYASLLTGCRDAVRPTAARESAALSRVIVPGTSAIAAQYAADFVATAATGSAMNAGGDVVGTSYLDTGCGPFCLPPQQTVVWRGGLRIVLPSLPGLTGIYPSAINAQGWIVGLAGVPGTQTRAVLWRPSGASTYTITDLGILPGTTRSEAGGLDDLGRVVGWSTTSNIIGPSAPFLWTLGGGMVNLATQGFPNEKPLALSPGGTVATSGNWFRLGNPASVTPLAAPPPSFRPPGTFATAINDAGEQARFLVPTTSQSLIYLFRYLPSTGWQQLSTLPTGGLSRFGVGSVNATGDITATVQSIGVVAAGPNGLAQSLSSRLSPAYLGATIGIGGPMNASGEILTQVMIGRSQRLMRLVPVTPCTGNCVRTSQIVMQGSFVQDPAHPGQCFQGGKAYNLVTARVKVTTETSAVLANARVNGRFLDDYWTDRPLSIVTNGRGIAKFTHKGLCGVGAVAFLVDKVSAGTRTFDRTTGVVANSVIPQ